MATKMNVEMVLKLKDQATGPLKKFNKELDKTKKKIADINKLNASFGVKSGKGETAGGRTSGGSSGRSGGIGAGGVVAGAGGVAAGAGVALGGGRVLAGLKLTSSAIKDIIGIFGQLAQSVNSMGGDLRSLTTSFIEINSAIQKGLAPMDAWVKSAEDIDVSISLIESTTAKTDDEIIKLTKTLRKNTDQIDKDTDSQNKNIKATGNNTKSKKEQIGTLGKLTKAFKVGLLAASAFFASIAAGALAFIGATKRAVSYADAIGKAAAVAGISAESLQELRYAFELAGVEIKQTDEGLRRFTRRLGEFRNTGAGPAKTALENLGLATRVATGDLKTSEQTLNAVIDLMGQIKDQSQRAAVAAKLFGDDAGPKLALALGQGIEKIDQLRLKARELGLVLGNDVIKNAEAAQDEFSTLGQIIKVQLTAAFLELLPQVRAFVKELIDNKGAISKFAKDFASLARVTLGWAFSMAKGVVELSKLFGLIDYSLDEQVKQASRRFLDLNEQLRILEKRGQAGGAQGGQLRKQVELARQAYSDLLDQKVKIEKTKNEIQKASTEIGGRTSGDLAKLPATFGKVTKASTEMADAITEAEEAFQALIDQGTQLSESVLTPIELYNTQIERLNLLLKAGAINQDTFNKKAEEYKQTATGGVYAQTRTEMENLAIELKRLDDLYSAGLLTQDEYARAVFDANEAIAQDTEETTNAVQEFWLEAARGMQNAMSDFFFDAMQGDMNDLVGNFKKMIDQMVADFLASQLSSYLLGNFGATGSIGGAIGGLFGRAEGGPVNANQPYIVGEQGPELMVPNSSGTIVPNDSLGGNQVSINITSWDSRDTMQALESNRRYISELVNGTNSTYNLNRRYG